MNAHFCPDCGGILESVHPPWLATIALASMGATEEPPAAGRRCLLCGYHDPLEPPDSNALSQAARGR
jgi:hypothetical protein